MPKKQVKKRRSSTLDRKDEDAPVVTTPDQPSQSRNVKKKPDPPPQATPKRLILSTPQREGTPRFILSSPRPTIVEGTPGSLRIKLKKPKPPGCEDLTTFEMEIMPPPPKPQAKNVSDRIGAAQGTRKAQKALESQLVNTAQATMGSLTSSAIPATPRQSATPDYFQGTPQYAPKEVDEAIFVDSDDDKVGGDEGEVDHPLNRRLFPVERVPDSQKTAVDDSTCFHLVMRRS
ncbi:MAG: hypothetical protein Q9167_007117 [Letrouitia subvulpina]